jgi:uncharacterized membrane protein
VLVAGMKMKLFNLVMWWAVIGAAVWVGGTVFMFSVINPQWSRDPPDSVRQFFLQTHFNEYIGHFFGPPFMAFRSFIPQLLVVILGWNLKKHRPHLLSALVCTVLAITFTLFYIYPINDLLMIRAGAGMDTETVQRLTRHWLIADRIRFAISFFGFIQLLKAFRLDYKNSNHSPKNNK